MIEEKRKRKEETMHLQKIVHVAYTRCRIILLVKKKLPLILNEIYSIFIKVLLQICNLVSGILG